MRVHADTGLCVSAGLCVLAVPEVFTQSDEDGTVRLLTGRPLPGLHQGVRTAAARCPSGAITVDDEPSGSE